MDARELFEFDRINTKATEFAMAATDDYAACRCCLLNGLFPGLRLGSEAVEKYLKAFVLYVDRSHNVRQYEHKIKEIASVASKLNPGFEPMQYSNVIDRLEMHYRQRYPDVPNFNRGASTAELVGIDEFVLYICDSLPIPEVPKFRSYGYFFFVCCPWTPRDPYKEWLERDNVTLGRVRSSLMQRYEAMEKELGCK